MSLLAVSLSLTIFNINNTVTHTDQKADEIAKTTKIIELELMKQIKGVQNTLNSNNHVLNSLGNQSEHMVDNVTK